MRNFEEAVSNRRTIYTIDKKVTVSTEDIVSTVERVTRDVPSAFNSQSSRVIVLFGVMLTVGFVVNTILHGATGESTCQVPMSDDALLPFAE